jgi:competence protein ComEA
LSIEKHWYWLGGFIVIGILLGAGIIFLVTRPPRGSPITLLPPPTPAPVTVYVTGSINQPGLYSFPPGSRVNDAIQAAGGFTSDANTSALNLAGVLSDGQKIDVPGLGTPFAPVGGDDPGTAAGAVVNINTATLEQLDSLPGIGPTYAQDIIDYRNANGLFTKIEDLMNVPGIGEGKFEAIKDLITVGTSP